MEYDATEIAPSIRHSMALYEAARALIGYVTPDFDEVQRISVCANGVASASTYFLPMEEHLETRIATRGYMEAKVVVAVAGRCAEQLVLGEAHLSTAGGADLVFANNVAREMVYRCGFGRRLGPVALQDDDANFLKREATRPVANISTELAMVACEDVADILDAAEAKAYWGLVKNYDALGALAQALVEREVLNRADIVAVLNRFDLVRFEHREIDGFCWERDGSAAFPGGARRSSDARLRAVGVTREGVAVDAEEGAEEGAPATDGQPQGWWSPSNPYRVRSDVARLLLTRDAFPASMEEARRRFGTDAAPEQQGGEVSA